MTMYGAWKSLGIMNGTSLDGVDYVLIESDKSFKKICFLGHVHKRFPKKIKEKLFAAAENRLSTYDLSILQFELGELYGKEIKDLKKRWSWDICGLHGQTIHHQGGKATWQIGHPGFIFREQPKPVYYDFRSNDIIAGGQGAPFAPFFQKVLAEQLKQKVCAFHNLGGISNLTVISGNKVQAWDTGPANILLDLWMAKTTNKAFDRDGEVSRQGLPDPNVVRAFLSAPFFKRKGPKSTGREYFNESFIDKVGGKAFSQLSFEDQMATLTELTARSLADSYTKLPSVPKIYFYGGGVNNSYLMDRVQYWMPETEILTTDSIGWPSQAFEASLMAFLAMARHFNRVVHLPAVTGAKKAMPLGSAYSGA